ncbi:MAG: hypothetical protein DMF61_11675 [Blastocatellia bacterium AA13]|nr:MAG: hypothetical protein DMF61_11675 [Blastocatellia bacterium AA13]
MQASRVAQKIILIDSATEILGSIAFNSAHYTIAPVLEPQMSAASISGQRAPHQHRAAPSSRPTR